MKDGFYDLCCAYIALKAQESKALLVRASLPFTIPSP